MILRSNEQKGRSIMTKEEDDNVLKTIKELEPSKELKEALEELDYMEKHPEEYKSYTNLEDLMKDLLEDDDKNDIA